MAVLLVVGYVYLERCHLDASLGGNALRGRVLLREYRLQFQLAELHIGTYTEEA